MKNAIFIGIVVYLQLKIYTHVNINMKYRW